MSDTTIVFFGIRIAVSEEEIESLEDRSHPWLIRAKNAGLSHYWGNFASPGEEFLLFLGKIVTKIGVEDNSAVQLRQEQFSALAADVSNRLSAAGFTGSPLLHIQFQPK